METPIFAPATGDSATALDVTISCNTPDSEIRYTINGEDPLPTDPLIQSGNSLRISKSATLKARAWVGNVSSAIAEEDYRITGAIALGNQHGLSLSQRGKLWAWGYQAHGRLGNGQTSGIAVIDPVRVFAPGGATNFDDAAVIAAGYDHSLVISANGEVFGFGRGVFGQLGHGFTSDANVAVPTVRDSAQGPGLSGATSIAAGDNFSLAALDSGEVFSWGLASNGRRGDGSTSGSRSYALPVLRGDDPVFPPLTGIREVVAGPAFGLAREAHDNETAGEGGGVWAWGLNNYGQLGIGSVTSPARAVPMMAAVGTPLSDVWSMAGGESHTAIVRWKDGAANLQGTVWSAGSGWQGRLGNGVNSLSYKALFPEQVIKDDNTPLSGVVQVAAGAAHTIAVDLDGHVWAWGSNAYGQLGNNSQSLATKAVQVVSEELDPITGLPKPLENIVSVAVGGTGGSGSSMALDEDGEIWVWGRNNLGQLGNGEQVVWGPTKLAIKHEENHVDEGSPSVSLSATVTKAIELGSVELSASPSHSGAGGVSRITKIDFFLRGALVGSRTTAPWTVAVDQLPAGDHHGYALVHDDEGVVAMSTALICTIDLDPEKDEDGDGVSNGEELVLNLDPLDPDTDGDGMEDGFELYNGFPADYGLNTGLGVGGTGPGDDYDGDLISNAQEEEEGMQPKSSSESPSFMTNPLRIKWFGKSGISYRLQWSTDLQNWSVYPHELIGENQEIVLNIGEVAGGTVPSSFFARLYPFDDIYHDTNSDGISDYMTLLLGLNPNSTDSDGDGVLDVSEDFDGDGIDNLGEIYAGTNPALPGEFPPHFVVVWRDIDNYWFDGSSQNPPEASENEIVIRESWTRGDDGYLAEFETIIQGNELSSVQLSQILNGEGFPATPPERATIAVSGSYVLATSLSTGSFGSSWWPKHLRAWFRSPVPSSGQNPDRSFLKVGSYYNGQDGFEYVGAEVATFTFDQGSETSQPLDLKEFIDCDTDTVGVDFVDIDLLPLDAAPEVLAVNSDFDEGRIDPATGYAIPDCDDEFIALEAERAHLAGKFAQDERITDDMHPGFFGVNPSLVDDDFWDGAIVTLRKLDIDDPDTGRLESGQIRLYGKWGNGPSEYRAIIPYDFDTLLPVNLVTGGINLAPNDSVYGASSPFPPGTSYYIEGVHPGKITLEWRYQKGATDLAHVQTFDVYTKKSPHQWRFDLAYKVRLETSNDPSGEVNVEGVPLPGEGYIARMERISEYYDFYQDCFLSPLRSVPTAPDQSLGWPGLARLAGSQVVAGLSDSQYGRLAVEGATWIAPFIPVIPSSFTTWSLAELENLQQTLFSGGRQIFKSVGWQHHAYRSSGLPALEWAESSSGDPEIIALLPAWQEIEEGVHGPSRALLDSAAFSIADREQNNIIVPTWGVISGIATVKGWSVVDAMFTAIAKNPCTPSGWNFKAMFPAGHLSNTSDRWSWIHPSTPGGVLATWNAHPASSREALVADSLASDGHRFAVMSSVPVTTPPISGPYGTVFPGGTIVAPVLVWDFQDVP